MKRALLLLAFLAACGADPDRPPATPPVWREEVGDLPGALLSVAGSPGDLWAVGGGLGNGTGAIVLHDGGDGWERLDPGIEPTLWWIWAAGDGEAFAVGEKGTILRRRAGAWEPAPPVTTATLYGVWGSGPGDVWAVGGSPLGGGPDDVVLHFDGVSWSQVEVPEPDGAVLFKVWGSGPDDVWIVGERGTVLHASGGALERRPVTDPAGVPLPVRLVTVSGAPQGEVWAVGGPDPTGGPPRTMIFRLDRAHDAFELVPAPAAGAVLNGVSTGQDGTVFAVGFGGVKLWRDRDGTWHDGSREGPRLDFHAVHVLPGGGALAAGGDFASIPDPGDLVRGWLYRYSP